MTGYKKEKMLSVHLQGRQKIFDSVGRSLIRRSGRPVVCLSALRAAVRSKSHKVLGAE